MVRIGGTVCLDPSTPEGKHLLETIMDVEHVASVEVDAVHDDGNINFVVMMG